MADLPAPERTARVELLLTGPVDHLRLVWQTGEILLETVRLPDDPEGERFNVLVAIQEMVTNVLRHAHRLDESLPIRVVYDLRPDRFLVEIHDRGAPFDPRTWLAECGDDAIGSVPQQPGGFGILIAALVMDGIDYVRRDGWNVLTLTRNLVSAERPAPTESTGVGERAL